MDKQRQGEIAILLIKYMAKKRGFRISPEIGREFGNVAKEIGVSVSELKEFAKPIIQELMDEAFK